MCAGRCRHVLGLVCQQVVAAHGSAGFLGFVKHRFLHDAQVPDGTAVQGRTDPSWQDFTARGSAQHPTYGPEEQQVRLHSGSWTVIQTSP